MRPRMKRQMILKVDDDYDLDNLPEIVKEAIGKGAIQWPESQMTGTKTYYSKRLLLIMTVLTRGELTRWLNKAYPSKDDQGRAANVDLGLDWKILAVEGETVQQETILKFMNDIPVFDENGEQIGVEDVTDLTGKLQTFAGHTWLFN